ncbi:MAG: hypothetical protein AABX29_09940 [Nanoarchaeota archaeon]
MIKTFLAGAFSGGGVGLIAVIYFVKNPEKFEKLLGIFYGILSKFWSIYQYQAIKNEVQGKINSFASNLEIYTSETFPRITLKWAGTNEDEEIIWDDFEAIIVMRDRRGRNKNFVHAAYFFTSKVLMKRAKRHLTKQLSTALDLFATKKILEQQNKFAVEQFMQDYFVPKVESSEAIVKFLKQFVNIDQVGMFLPILVQELTYLGNKVFLSTKSSDVLNEVKLLINFLENFSLRQVGDTTTADEFIGNFMRCSIKIVASRQAREGWKVINHSNRALEVFKRGCENIYLIGSAESTNKKFVDSVVKTITDQAPNLEIVKKITFPGQIIINGKITNVESYFIHLHNPSKVQHVFTERNLEQISI